MKNDRRRLLLAAGAVLAQAALPGAARALAADTTVDTQQPGALRIAVYADFPPYSARGKGVDVALGKALAEKLGIDAARVAVSIDALGNTGSASIPITLHRNDARIPAGGKVLLLSFGGGYSVGAALLERI